MLCRLGQIVANLQSDNLQISDYWKRLFEGSPVVSTAATGEPLSLSLQLARSLSVPPQTERIYRDNQGILDVYGRPDGGYVLHFLQGALVHLHPDRDASAAGTVTEEIFDHDRLEDVTYVSLAALLRRRGHYLVHAAAVSFAGAAILFVGPSHSGKTTTGMALTFNGWKHMAGDVVIMAQTDGEIVAHPTPGILNIRPRTFDLLPELRELSARGKEQSAVRRLQLKASQWSEPAPVAAICFPQITSKTKSRLEPLDAPVALARLMEESIDRWDTSALLDHMVFLTTLSRQASHYRLLLGSDVDKLSQHLKEVL